MKFSQSTRTWFDATLAATVFIGLLGMTTYLLYAKSVSALEDQIKAGLISTVSASATTLDGDIHRHFQADTSPDDPQYHTMAMHMERIRQAATDVRYIYTCILQPDGVYFVVNPSPQNDGDGDGLPDPPPALMTLYDDAPQELVTALQHQQVSVSSVPYQDQWGTFISAYAPFYDAQGEFVGVLAMDLELSGFYKRLSHIQQVFSKAKIIILFIGLITGMVVWWMRRAHVNNLNALETTRMHADQTLAQMRYRRDVLLEVVRYCFHLLPESYREQPTDRERQSDSDNISTGAAGQTDATDRVETVPQLHTAEPHHQAVYGYALSFGDMTTVIESFYLTDWFDKLNTYIRQEAYGSHQWLGEIEHPVQGDCQILLDTFCEFYSSLSQILHQPVSAQTQIERECLDHWQLLTVISIQDERQWTRCRRLFKISAAQNMTHRLAALSAMELHLLKVIYLLQQLSSELTLTDDGVLSISWQVSKERSE
ncbi:PDC sensor domain-containing protein [Vibrio rhizosphaerae]|uniref:PDC sensor domain-containing protein n=1 Tax=Vibrio rhizosphaerae TaxID=398736 RepID=A0ABU4J033_9VIBR|nr:PDC sensor domain-containing protein [Vibrio rhizosphaerae]MDW6094783.1 PDC sensor domain-containing protein [Vibrio rhizosphaerae]